MKKIAFFALASGLALAASAQGNVGVLKDVKGAITVSGQQTMKRATSGMQVADGASVLVASDGAATLVLNNGCVMSLKPNQHVAINSKLPCAEQQAAVQQLFPAYKVAQAGVNTPLPAAGAAGAGAGAGAIGGIATGTIVAGAVAAGVLAAVASNESNSDNKPASGQ